MTHQCNLPRMCNDSPREVKAPSAYAARKRKTWCKARFRCFLRLSTQRTSNEDGLLSHPTASTVTHYQQITKFPWTTVHYSCAIGPVMLHSSEHTARKRIKWWKVGFRCYLRPSAQRTSNQGALIRDPTVNKVTHYPQITKFPWSTRATSRKCTAVPRAL